MMDSSNSSHDVAGPEVSPRDRRSPDAPLEPWQALALEQYRELNANYRSVWDIYIKFYTVFLTANVLGIGVVIDRVDPENRPLIAAAFIAQNLLAAATAAGLAAHGRACGRRLEATAATLLPPDAEGMPPRGSLRLPPIPDTLGTWAGVANVLSHLFLIVIWVAVVKL